MTAPIPRSRSNYDWYEVSPPRPPSPDYSQPFYRCQQNVAQVLLDELSEEEKAATERWLKQQEEDAKRQFAQEALKRSHPHLFGNTQAKK